MKIILTDELIVSLKVEKHFKLYIDGKEILVSKYINNDEFDNEAETEIFKGKELLTEEEQEEVIDYVNDLE